MFLKRLFKKNNKPQRIRFQGAVISNSSYTDLYDNVFLSEDGKFHVLEREATGVFFSEFIRPGFKKPIGTIFDLESENGLVKAVYNTIENDKKCTFCCDDIGSYQLPDTRIDKIKEKVSKRIELKEFLYTDIKSHIKIEDLNFFQSPNQVFSSDKIYYLKCIKCDAVLVYVGHKEERSPNDFSLHYDKLPFSRSAHVRITNLPTGLKKYDISLVKAGYDLNYLKTDSKNL